MSEDKRSRPAELATGDGIRASIRELANSLERGDGWKYKYGAVHLRDVKVMFLVGRPHVRLDGGHLRLTEAEEQLLMPATEQAIHRAEDEALIHALALEVG